MSEIEVETIAREERIARIDALIPREGESALDVGCGDHFRIFYARRKFNRMVALNPHEPNVLELWKEFGDRPGWDFPCLDVRDYHPAPEEKLDVVTMFHVAEHLDLYDLSRVLIRLTQACRGVFVLETPEQYDDNERAAVARDNSYERHLSLVTAGYLAQWEFVPEFRYWQNNDFSNAVYVRKND